MGLRVYVMPPFLRGTPAVGPDGRSLPAVRGGQRGAGCDRRSASCRARQPSASTLPMTRSMASCSSKKKEAPASSLGRGVRRQHEPRPEQGNVRAHIRDGKPEWRQGHSCRKRASGRHHMDKTGRKTGNQWLTKAGNDKEDTYAMACILLKSIGAPGRNRTHGPQLRRLLLYPTELLAQIWQQQSIKQGFPEVKPDLARFARLGKGGRHGPERAGHPGEEFTGGKGRPPLLSG